MAVPVLKAEHPLVPSLAGEPVGVLACFRRPLRRCPDRCAVDRLSRLRAHGVRMRQATRDRQAATDCGGWRDWHNGSRRGMPDRSCGYQRSSLCVGRSRCRLRRLRRHAQSTRTGGDDNRILLRSDVAPAFRQRAHVTLRIPRHLDQT